MVLLESLVVLVILTEIMSLPVLKPVNSNAYMINNYSLTIVTLIGTDFNIKIPIKMMQLICKKLQMHWKIILNMNKTTTCSSTEKLVSEIKTTALVLNFRWFIFFKLYQMIGSPDDFTKSYSTNLQIILK